MTSATAAAAAFGVVVVFISGGLKLFNAVDFFDIGGDGVRGGRQALHREGLESTLKN